MLSWGDDTMSIKYKFVYARLISCKLCDAIMPDNPFETYIKN